MLNHLLQLTGVVGLRSWSKNPCGVEKDASRKAVTDESCCLGRISLDFGIDLNHEESKELESYMKRWEERYYSFVCSHKH